MTDFGKGVWIDGSIIPMTEAKTSVINHALHYGSAVFEGVRAYETDKGPAIFRATEHYDRLHYSAGVLQIEIPYTSDQLIEATRQVLKNNELSSAYIRPFVSYGEGKMGLNPKGAKESVLIAAWHWGKYLSSDPITVGISPWQRISPQALQCDAKVSGHYVNSIMSSFWAEKNNYQEALMLDYQGNVAEGPGENFFAIKDGQVFTPPLGTILAGITRQTVIELLKEEFGITVIERTIHPDELSEFDEMFFTGTAAEITLIKSIDGNPVGKQDFAISRPLAELYDRVVRGQEAKYNHWLTW